MAKKIGHEDNRRDEKEERIGFHNEELHSLYRSSNINLEG